MKAKFELKQATFKCIEFDNKFNIFICQNEKEVVEVFEDIEKTFYEYDYNEILTDSLYLKNQIELNPQDYLDFKVIELDDKAKIIELQARVDYLEMVVA